jgi:hypothetical protein
MFDVVHDDYTGTRMLSDLCSTSRPSAPTSQTPLAQPNKNLKFKPKRPHPNQYSQ